MSRLFSVDSGYKELPNLSRTVSSVIVLADSPDDALQFAQRHYPSFLAEGTEHRVVEVNHVFINWPDGETVVVEKKHSKDFHC